MQHTMYSIGQLKYRWHLQMKLVVSVLCGSPHCFSYWRDRSGLGTKVTYGMAYSKFEELNCAYSSIFGSSPDFETTPY